MSDSGQDRERRFPTGGEIYLNEISKWGRDDILKFVEALLSASTKKRPENGGDVTAQVEVDETTRNT
ncbi:hypothetical protein K2P56_02830 [Patescibacteria group bacterium]|nr:hypothetical protein [Patescibacteria group bacterium]